MAITIDGSSGIASVDGSAGSPSVRGTDANSGILYTADAIKFSTGGTQRAVIDNNGLSAAGHVIQVVQGIKKDTSSNSTSATNYWNSDVTVDITPSHASNKILLTGYVCVAVAGPQHNIGVAIHKAGSLITDYLADSAGSRSRVGSLGTNSPGGGSSYIHNTQACIPFEFLDTGGGTSAITYGIAIRNPSSISRTIKINYADTDTDNIYHYRAVSVITATEIAA